MIAEGARGMPLPTMSRATASKGRGHAERSAVGSLSPAYLAIYAAVMRIPSGSVATYGQIARVADLPGRARQVGYALHALPDGSPVPWQRVVNARGEISLSTLGGGAEGQRRLLRAEGVEFDRRGRIDLGRFSWLCEGS